MGILPGVDNDQATVQDNHRLLLGLFEDAEATDCAVDVPHHVGGCSCRKPAPEIDNRFEEAGGKASPGPATRHANTLHSPLRLTLKKKIQNSKREADEEPILGQDYQDSKSDLTPKLPSQ